MNEGWICPRCGRVNAPSTPYCDCNYHVSCFTSDHWECDHNWILNHNKALMVLMNGTHYICTKCGLNKAVIPRTSKTSKVYLWR